MIRYFVIEEINGKLNSKGGIDFDYELYEVGEFLSEKLKTCEKGELRDCLIEFDRIAFTGDGLHFKQFAGRMMVIKQ